VPYTLATPLVVTGPKSDVLLDVPVRRVAGAITLRGGPTACTARLAAQVSFIDAAKNLAIPISASCDDAGATRYAGEVFPGTYDVVVSGKASAIPPTGYLGARAALVP
jgi:hypothetical protein